MVAWKLEQTRTFEKSFNKLPRQIRTVIRKKIAKLTCEQTGKPLKYDFFREKKVKKWRIYYTKIRWV